MKILYTDIHLHSLNPTNTLLSAMVATAARVTRFGPGYVSREVLAAGIERFVDSTGPYDALFIGPNVPVLSSPAAWPASLAYTQRYAALASDPESGMKYLKDLFASLPRLVVPLRVASLVTLDYYGSAKAQIDRLNELGLHVLAPDLVFAQRIEELPAWASGEEHFQRKKERLTNAWVDFISDNPSRVLSSLHFVAESEFFFRTLEERTMVASVPGAEYLLRGQARKSLKKKGIRSASKLLFNAYRVLNKLRIPVYSKFIPLRMFNVSYQGSLLDTQFVYTARGGFGIPVRKFLEIPAAGAMMICTPPLGFAEMGFVDGEHYVEAGPEDAPDVIMQLSQDLGRAQAMAGKAQQLVWDAHSLSARGAQLRKCLESIQAGSYQRSRWQAGKFVVEERPCAG
jgi:hypothetical protein